MGRTWRSGAMLSVSLALVASLAAACSASSEYDGFEDEVGEKSGPTTCPIQLVRYPVMGKHNNGYDKTAGNSSLWSCDDANSNSDFVGGDHLGNDIWAAEGTPLVATVNGTLTLTGWSDYSGNKVTIKDNCGWYHFYCHLKDIAPGMVNGVKVTAGQVIGSVGKTGTASNGVVHLHYSIYPDGNYDAGVDPWPYLHAVEHGVCGCTAKPEICNGADDDCDGTADNGDVCVIDDNLIPQMGMMDGAANTDIDGDGRADVCARSSFGIGCVRSAEDGFGESISGPELSNGNGWSSSKYYGTVRMADVNGDRKADVCARSSAGVHCWLSDGAGFPTQIEGPPLSDASGWGEIRFWSTLRLADVDGDAKADVCARSASAFQCWLSDGNGFPTAIVGPELSDEKSWGNPQYYATLRMADVNGDGKSDVCARAAAGFRCWLSDGAGFPTEVIGPELSNDKGWGDAKYWSTIRMGDVDGNGKADVCARSSAGFHCWLSDGSGFGEAIDGPALSDAQSWGEVRYYSTIRLADLSGDGKADLCARGSVGLHCWLSTGSGFSEGFELTDLSDAGGWTKPEYFSTIRFGDVDSNGTNDVCARAAAGVRCWPFSGSSFGAAVAGPEWSDATGWAGLQYYETFHVAGGCSPKPESCNGRDDDCDGQIDDDCSAGGGGSGGNGGGWGNPGGSGGSAAGAGSGGNDSEDSSGDDSSCALRSPPSNDGAAGAWALLALLALLRTARPRRRPRA